LVEITRLAVACGAKPQTMAGLAGMGDLVLTCTGGLSRNRTVGSALGKGQQLQEIVVGMHGMVAEGVLTTNAAIGLAQKHKVEMPITEQIYAILHQAKSPQEAIRALMTRPGKAEDRF
jgi:glycerol-3-phosphate dehydrogenase (NAD(P)+)